jgi:hypothetical protein
MRLLRILRAKTRSSSTTLQVIEKICSWDDVAKIGHHEEVLAIDQMPT